MASLRIKTTTDSNGQQCVPPECMRLLLAFADHRNVCDQCERSMKDGGRTPACVTGAEIIRELLQQPEVEMVK